MLNKYKPSNKLVPKRHMKLNLETGMQLDTEMDICEHKDLPHHGIGYGMPHCPPTRSPQHR